MPSKKAAEPTSDEGRRAKRITKVLPVECRIVDLADNRLAKHILSEGDIFGGRTINISKTGLQVHSDYELDPKTVVEIQMALSHKDKAKIRLTAKVAWAKRNAFDIYGRWAMGMHILSAKPSDMESLWQFFEAH